MGKLIPFFIFLALLACKPEVRQQDNSFYTVNDDLGRAVKIPKGVTRVLGLSPSSTELLYAVCPDTMIVGRTQNCDYPERVLSKPVVNNYPLDLEAVLKLKPDVIFAVEGITPLEDARRIEEMGIPVYFQQLNKVEDVFQSILKVGEITDLGKSAKLLVDSLRGELLAVNAKSKGKFIPRVLCVIWFDPIYVHGYYSIMSDKLKYAGAVNALDSSLKKTSPELTREYLIKTDPDILLSSSSEIEQKFFDKYPELRKMKFYKNGKVFKTTDDLQSRPGPRVVEAVKELYRLIHEN